MSRILALLAQLPNIVAAVVLATITLLVVAQVIVRYVLGGSLAWSEELTRLLFVWMVLVAASRAQPVAVRATSAIDEPTGALRANRQRCHAWQ